jgi:hypothetical protein
MRWQPVQQHGGLGMSDVGPTRACTRVVEQHATLRCLPMVLRGSCTAAVYRAS